jgi:hypothetical protein
MVQVCFKPYQRNTEGSNTCTASPLTPTLTVPPCSHYHTCTLSPFLPFTMVPIGGWGWGGGQGGQGRGTQCPHCPHCRCHCHYHCHYPHCHHPGRKFRACTCLGTRWARIRNSSTTRTPQSTQQLLHVTQNEYVFQRHRLLALGDEQRSRG